MPDTREKLIELLGDKVILGRAVLYEVADHLIANGVTVLTEDEQRNIYTMQEIEELQNDAYDLGVDSALHNHFGLSWDEAAGLRKEIARLQAATQWIPVAERLPEETIQVLTVDDEKWIEIDTLSGEDWISDRKVTHWMPLPESPKERNCK